MFAYNTDKTFEEKVSFLKAYPETSLFTVIEEQEGTKRIHVQDFQRRRRALEAFRWCVNKAGFKGTCRIALIYMGRVMAIWHADTASAAATESAAEVLAVGDYVRIKPERYDPSAEHKDRIGRIVPGLTTPTSQQIAARFQYRDPNEREFEADCYARPEHFEPVDLNTLSSEPEAVPVPHEDWWIALDTYKVMRQERDDLAARLARAEAALRPFALAAEDNQIQPETDEEALMTTVGESRWQVRISLTNEWDDAGESDFLTIAHLRAAKEVYKALTGE